MIRPIRIGAFLCGFCAIAGWVPAQGGWEAVVGGDSPYASGFGEVASDGAWAATAFGDHVYVGMSNSSTGAKIFRSPNGSTWTQANTDGFGEGSTVSGLDALTAIGGYVYAGGWRTGGVEVRRSSDGSQWVPVSDAGFGDSNNRSVFAFTSLAGAVYAGTFNMSTGAEIWRAPNGTDWTQVNTDGFGSSANWAIYSMEVFDGWIYAGTGGYSGPAQIWRSSDGTTWDPVTSSGFDDSGNTNVRTLGVFGGQLYAGTNNSVSGGELWRSSDGVAWSQVNADGFGEADSSEITSLTVLGSDLYAGVTNVAAGGEVWRSSDGTTWSRIAWGGFDSPDNTDARTTAAFDNDLYVTTRNTVEGAEIWCLAGVDTTVFDNGAFAGTGGVEATSQTVADDLQLSSSGTITGASIIISDPTQNFLASWDGTVSWWLFSDINSGRAPGAEMASGAGQVAEFRTIAPDVYDVSFGFGAGVTIAGGTPYWLAVHLAADWSGDDGLYWGASSAGSGGTALTMIPAGPGEWIDTGLQLSFSVRQVSSSLIFAAGFERGDITEWTSGLGG